MWEGAIHSSAIICVGTHRPAHERWIARCETTAAAFCMECTIELKTVTDVCFFATPKYYSVYYLAVRLAINRRISY